MPTVKGVLQKYHEGQNIFRREAVACLVARIEQLEKYIASQQSVQADKCRTGLPHVFKWDGTLNTPEMLECENCGIRR